MKVILTNHAKERMIERNISLKQIKETIELPDYQIAEDSKIKSYKKFNSKVLNIIYTKLNNTIKVITVIWKWN